MFGKSQFIEFQCKSIISDFTIIYYIEEYYIIYMLPVWLS